MAELTEQLETLAKLKAKADKDRAQTQRDLETAQSAADSVSGVGDVYYFASRNAKMHEFTTILGRQIPSTPHEFRKPASAPTSTRPTRRSRSW